MRRIRSGSIIVLAVGATLLSIVAAGAATAKGPGGGHGGHGSGGGTITLVLMNGDTAPHYGGQVTFDVSTTATDKPSVKVNCYQRQDNTLVYTASAGFYPDYPWPWLQDFTLKSGAWTGGAANCTAELYYWDGRKFITLTSIGFAVDA
jgi:hypothetical protein